MPVRGGSLAAFELTEADPGAPTVLAVHGITSNSHSWLTVARALGGRLRLVAVDLRGRGGSFELPGPYGLSAHAEDLAAVLAHLELGSADLAGHSLGAYIVAWLAVSRPELARHVILVDGGLPLPGLQVEDPRRALEAFLGPAFARLEMRFPTRQAYLKWWQAHPAICASDVVQADLAAYLDHDLGGHEPELFSRVAAEAVYADGADLVGKVDAAADLAGPATLLCAPLGLQGEPSPMQPFDRAEAWAEQAPHLRRAELVAGVNHYTITMGEAGSHRVAEAMVEATGA